MPKIQDRAKILKEVHDGHGHFGQEATWKRLYFGYWWPRSYEILSGIAPRNINADPLQDLSVNLGMERLFFVMDKELAHEEGLKSKEQDLSKERIPIGSAVVMVRHSRRNKLDQMYNSKKYTVIGKFHCNTYVLINDKGVKLKRAISGNQIKAFAERNKT